ncbi:MAG: prenyltransferase/squalene oxidase repeat-containing protein [Pseudomonadota bacterium]
MTPRGLLHLLTAYGAVLALCSLLLFWCVRVDRSRVPRGPVLISIWQHGERKARVAATDESSAVRALLAEAAEPGATRVVEQIVDSAPVLPLGRLIFAASIAPARDGVSATYQGRTAYLTPDDLLKLEAYEAVLDYGQLGISLGANADKVLGPLAAELGTNADELFRHATFRRFCVERSSHYPKELGAADVSLDVVRGSVLNAARYLLHNQKRDGSFRYEVNAMTGDDEPGYNFPRHAGATYFLARTANQLHDSKLFRAAQSAAVYLKDSQTLRCGAHSCVGEGDTVDVGASALALLAYVELINGGAAEYHDAALDLAGFLRAQQRSDGDFQHIYSVAEQHPVDVQLEYYTGEAAFALSRVQRISGDARDLEASRHALSFLVQRPVLFLGGHYFWGPEHWTCQVLDDLWQRAPDRAALRFCLNWQANNRVLQYGALADRPGIEGGLSRGPFLSPRLTPLASRMEAAVATLSVARQAGVEPAELATLGAEIKSGLAFLLRYQYTPGPAYLMPDPRAVSGGFPGSLVDQHVRIDYPQHAGGALLRYWELEHAAKEQ